MSYPYPQDRHLDRKEKGDQPYDDAKESLAETQADIRNHAAGERDEVDLISEEERTELQEQNASERFRKIGDEMSKD